MTDFTENGDQIAAGSDSVVPPIVTPPVVAPPELIQAEPVAETPIGENVGMRMVLPVGRAWQAIVAGYMGLLSVLPGFGVLALVFGIWGVVAIRQDPKKHGMGRAIFGIVMGAIGTVFFAFVFWEVYVERYDTY